MSKQSVAVAVTVLALAVYANSLANGFVWDDPIILARQLPLFDSPLAVLFPPAGVPQFAPDYYRPLVIGSYLIDRGLGAGSPWVFHLTVVLAHALATLAVFGLGMQLFARVPGASDQRRLIAAGVAAACFAVHPVHTEAVAWVAGRADVFAGLFGVFAAYAHCRSDREPRFAYLAAAALFLALLSKEVAVSVIVVLLAIDWLMPRSEASSGSQAPAPRAVRRRGRGSESATVPSALRYGTLAVAVVLYGVLRWSAISGGIATTSGQVEGSLPLLLTVAVGVYGGKLVAPIELNAYIADLPVGPMDLALGVAVIAAFAALIALSAVRGWRIVVLLLVWMAVTLAPSLTILFKIPEVPIAERYLYLPSVGYCLLLGWTIAAAALVGPRVRWLTAVAVVSLLAAAAAHAGGRNRVWLDDFSLWSATARANPTAGMPLRGLGGALYQRGDLAGAERAYEQALAGRNNDVGKVTIYSNLGTIALARGDLDRAEALYRKAVAVHETAEGAYNLGVIALQRAARASEAGDGAGARAFAGAAWQALGRAEGASPADPDIQVALAQTLEFLGRDAEARERYRRALGLGLSGARAAQVQARLSGG